MNTVVTSTSTAMTERFVTYSLNQNNPGAASLLIENAWRILGVIPRTKLRLCLSSDGYKVVKVTAWEHSAEQLAYNNHPALQQWCRFVLYGWRVKGDTSDPDTALDRMIEHVLARSRADYERHPDVTDETRVVWAGETVVECSTLVPMRDLTADELQPELSRAGIGTNSKWDTKVVPLLSKIAAQYHHSADSLGRAIAGAVMHVYSSGAPGDLRAAMYDSAARAARVIIARRYSEFEELEGRIHFWLTQKLDEATS